jgi:hypothetical protein
MTKNSYEKDMKEMEAFDNHNLKTYLKTCLHHTDKERLDAGCPVCQHRRVTELEVEKSRLQDSLDRLAVLWARETLDDYQQLELENARLRAIFPKILESLGNGSGCTTDVSLEFLEDIPQEIRLFLSNATKEDGE